MSVEVERYHGFITKVGESTVKSVNLPDWSLDYVEVPPYAMPDYRTALMQARMRIVKVSKMRIYFEQR